KTAPAPLRAFRVLARLRRSARSTWQFDTSRGRCARSKTAIPLRSLQAACCAIQPPAKRSGDWLLLLRPKPCPALPPRAPYRLARQARAPDQVLTEPPLPAETSWPLLRGRRSGEEARLPAPRAARPLRHRAFRPRSLHPAPRRAGAMLPYGLPAPQPL